MARLSMNTMWICCESVFKRKCLRLKAEVIAMLAKFPKVLCLAGSILMLVPGELVLAREEGRVIVISPQVGETIDREERDRYGLFPASQDFYSAQILKYLDGSYMAEITEEYSGVKKVRALPIDPPTLDRLRNRIDNFDELSSAEKKEIRARYENIREAITASSEPQEDKVIVISPDVGETIDQEERDRYALFPNSQDFHSAVILQKPDGNYVAEITEMKEGERDVRRVPISWQKLVELREQIDPVEVSFRAIENPRIVVTYRKHQLMEGRLLGFDSHSVLLGNMQSVLEPRPKHIALDEIRVITIKKSSKVMQGLGYGLLIGGVMGALVGYTGGDDPEGFMSLSAEDKASIGLFIGGLSGGLVGVIAGASAGTDEKIDLSQMSQPEKIKIVMRLSGL
jgi:hypothetical protein